MNDLEAIKFIMSLPIFTLEKSSFPGVQVMLKTSQHTVYADTMIKCAIQLKDLMNA